MTGFDTRGPQDDGLEALVDGVRPISIAVELTSRCNLRCTYCSVPHSPAYGAVDMSPETVDHVLDLLRGERLVGVGLSGRGELTHIDDWEGLVGRFKALRVNISVVTNLSTPLTWDMAHTLAGLDRLGVSIDTVDREVLRKMRRSVDLRTILSNICMIRAAALEMGKPRFGFGIFTVVNVSTVFELSKVAALTAVLGANSLQLQDLVMDYSDRVTDVDIRHISALPPDQLRKAVKEIMRAKAICDANRILFNVWEPFQAFMCGIPLESETVDSPHLDRYVRRGIPVAPGETRDCLQPWQGIHFMADGGVEPCCGGYGSVGSYKDAASLKEAANGEGIKTLRRELLTGNLSDLCRRCIVRGAVPIETLRAQVARHVS